MHPLLANYTNQETVHVKICILFLCMQNKFARRAFGLTCTCDVTISTLRHLGVIRDQQSKKCKFIIELPGAFTFKKISKFECRVI